VQEMIKQYPWLLGIAFWQAAIVAPISEEYGFRVLLVGWFESIQFGRDKFVAFLLGTNSEKPKESHEQTEDATWAGISQTSQLPYNSSSLSDAGLAADTTTHRPPWWPALLSGLLFGLAHISYGVSWVALILFGVVLGRLYQWRQSILPVILVHLLFNAMNVTVLGLSLVLPNKLGN